jgi:hypothetical protein
MDLKETEFDSSDSVQGPMTTYCEQINVLSDCIKATEFIDLLSNCQLLEKYKNSMGFVSKLLHTSTYPRNPGRCISHTVGWLQVVYAV